MNTLFCHNYFFYFLFCFFPLWLLLLSLPFSSSSRWIPMTNKKQHRIFHIQYFHDLVCTSVHHSTTHNVCVRSGSLFVSVCMCAFRMCFSERLSLSLYFSVDCCVLCTLHIELIYTIGTARVRWRRHTRMNQHEMCTMWIRSFFSLFRSPAHKWQSACEYVLVSVYAYVRAYIRICICSHSVSNLLQHLLLY